MANGMVSKIRTDVMISSTNHDLKEHRLQMRDAIWRAQWFPLMQEDFETIPNTNALEFSINMVDEADIYIGIIGIRYGFRPTDHRLNPKNLSITELEYLRAVERGIPRLIFIIGDLHIVEKQLLYQEENKDRIDLERFKNYLMATEIVSFFNSIEQLKSQAIQALFELKLKIETKKQDLVHVAKQPKSLTSLPIPPEFYAVPPYALTNKFVGRTTELKKLDNWLLSSNKIMIIEAIGGMGKSALTWEWAKTKLNGDNQLEGIMWWSFYETGATMGSFIEHALAYVSKRSLDEIQSREITHNILDFLSYLEKSNYLFILDGLERILIAYYRWNAAQMRDDNIENAESIIRDRDIRACTDLKDDKILKELLACKRTKIVISSRLLPITLEDVMGNLADGVQHIHLNGLSTIDSLTLVRAAGVKVKNEIQFDNFVARFGRHSLLVKLIAGRVNKFRIAVSDFDMWYQFEGKNLGVNDFDLRQAQTHILQYAFEGLNLIQRTFLAQIAAFGNPVKYETLQVFNPFALRPPKPVQQLSPETQHKLQDVWSRLFQNEEDDIQENDMQEEFQKLQIIIDEERLLYEAYLEEQTKYYKYLNSQEYTKTLIDFDKLLTELEDRNLLNWDRVKNIYDMHPVIRGFAHNMLSDIERRSTFDQIRVHFEINDIANIFLSNVDNLNAHIIIYETLIGADRLDEAATFYMSYLANDLDYTTASYYKAISLLEPLFVNAFELSPIIQNQAIQISILDKYALMLSYVGRVQDSLQVQAQAIKKCLDRSDLRNLVVLILNYGLLLRNTKNSSMLQITFQTALSLAEHNKDSSGVGLSLMYLLGFYAYTGQWDNVNTTYNKLSTMHFDNQWNSVINRLYAESLIIQDKDASAILDTAEKSAKSAKYDSELRHIKRLRGEIAIKSLDADIAITLFEDLVQMARKSGDFESILSGIGGLARAYALKGETAKALDLIKMETFHERFFVNIAEIYLLIGDEIAAEKYAKESYEWAWADGDPYVWYWELQRARDVLDKLNVSHPKLSKFDKSKLKEFPYQAEVNKIIKRISARG